MAEIKIAAETRTEFGKGAARRIRREDKVPAVLYGHGSDPVHVTLPGHQLMMALKNSSNALLTIAVDSDTHLAIPKQVQRDPIKGFIEHADLLIVKKGEKVTVDVGITLVGEAFPGTMVVHENTSISVEAEATHIPESFELSIEDLHAGTQLLASDLELPEGTELAVDPELLIVNITLAPTEEEVEAELAEVEAELGIEQDPSDAEVEAAAEAGDSEADAGESADADKE